MLVETAGAARAEATREGEGTGRGGRGCRQRRYGRRVICLCLVDGFFPIAVGQIRVIGFFSLSREESSTD